jgi:hypothetical protein
VKASGYLMAIALVLLCAPARAHHSFSEYYVEKDTEELDGIVVQFEYKNPHAWLHVEAADGFGRRVVYAAEWGSVSGLERQGVLKTTLKPGDRVRVWVSPNRNPTDTRVRLKRIELPDGRRVGGQGQDRESR